MKTIISLNITDQNTIEVFYEIGFGELVPQDCDCVDKLPHGLKITHTWEIDKIDEAIKFFIGKKETIYFNSKEKKLKPNIAEELLNKIGLCEEGLVSEPILKNTFDSALSILKDSGFSKEDANAIHELMSSVKRNRMSMMDFAKQAFPIQSLPNGAVPIYFKKRFSELLYHEKLMSTFAVPRYDADFATVCLNSDNELSGYITGSSFTLPLFRTKKSKDDLVKFALEEISKRNSFQETKGPLKLVVETLASVRNVKVNAIVCDKSIKHEFESLGYDVLEADIGDQNYLILPEPEYLGTIAEKDGKIGLFIAENNIIFSKIWRSGD
jgi:hypothetical protein